MSYKSVLALFTMVVVLVPILRPDFPLHAEVLAYECGDKWPTHFWIASGMVFGIDILVSLFACSTVEEPFYYIVPWEQTAAGAMSTIE